MFLPRSFSNHYPVAPFGFGAIEGGIGRPQDRLRGRAVLRQDCDAEREGDRSKLLAAVLYSQVFNGCTQVFGSLLHHRQGGGWEDEQKLFATVAAGNVFGSAVRFEEMAHSTYDHVTRLMTEGIIEALEVVDLEQHHPDGMSVAYGAVYFTPRVIPPYSGD